MNHANIIHCSCSLFKTHWIFYSLLSSVRCWFLLHKLRVPYNLVSSYSPYLSFPYLFNFFIHLFITHRLIFYISVYVFFFSYFQKTEQLRTLLRVSYSINGGPLVVKQQAVCQLSSTVKIFFCFKYTNVIHLECQRQSWSVTIIP